MFNSKNRELDAAFDQKIAELVRKMHDEPNADMASYYAGEIAKIRDFKSTSQTKPWDPNALLAAGTNLAGILLILNHERASVVASKAIGFVQKLR